MGCDTACRATTNRKDNTCTTCGSTNTYGMSRVVWYYSIIENWNSSKQAEFKDRQKGDYKLGIQKDRVLEKVQEVIIVE
ncbi:hypothetical protein C0585_06065 [Candidatus Woesearchaeota archaeon]|nr:MAG: hypothetical protein C0585_06065 [Candidatus Woesearchaeota archaeon]